MFSPYTLGPASPLASGNSTVFSPLGLDSEKTSHLCSVAFETVAAAAYNALCISTVWKLLLLAFVFANFKNFPLVYHLRLLNAFRFVLRSQRTPEGPQPEQLFQPIITSSKAPLLETDLYMHKSNSSYFSDHDIARTHLICTLFSKGIEKVRGGTAGIVNGKVSSFAVALGAVSCSFRRELKPYESYDMWTRVLSWDEKWIYVVTHFVKKGAQITPREFTLYPRQNSQSSTPPDTPRGSVSGASSRRPSSHEASVSRHGSISGESSAAGQSAIAASALSKLVFKNGRITIAPAVMLEASGLLPSKPADESAEETNARLAANQLQANVFEPLAPQKAMQITERLSDGGSSNSSTSDSEEEEDDNDETSQSSRRDSPTAAETWHMIEAERKRGLKIASLLAAQNALEHEFNDSEAIGRHSDGTGIGGVVATLAQLGHLSNYQLL